VYDKVKAPPAKMPLVWPNSYHPCRSILGYGSCHKQIKCGTDHDIVQNSQIDEESLSFVAGSEAQVSIFKP